MNANFQAVGRDLGLDAIKALATLLVIIGHVIQYTNVDFDNSIFFRVIYSFHMPLFMFVSGYLVPKTAGDGFLTSKFKQLVVPFLLWSVLLISLDNFAAIQAGGVYVLFDRFHQMVLRPDNGGLWFLWVLFLNFLMFTLLEGKYRLALSAVVIVTLTILQFLDRDFTLFGLGLFRWHYFFFLFGFLAGNYGLLSKIRINTWIVLAVTILLITQWDRAAITSFFGFAIKSNVAALLLALVVKYICAIGAIIVIFSIKEKIKIKNWWVNILSVESLGYYATQYIFLLVFTTVLSAKALNSVLLYQVSVFVLILTCCTLMILLLKRYSFPKKYLLGKLDKKKMFAPAESNIASAKASK